MPEGMARLANTVSPVTAMRRFVKYMERADELEAVGDSDCVVYRSAAFFWAMAISKACDRVGDQ